MVTLHEEVAGSVSLGRIVITATLAEQVPYASGFCTKTREWNSPTSLLTDSNRAQGLGQELTECSRALISKHWGAKGRNH